MTSAEAKDKIVKEFIDRYHRWLSDRTELSDHDYGWKYGYLKSERLLSLKDNQQAVIYFQKYIFCAYRTDDAWEKEGYDRRAIWQLHRDGFLSEDLSMRKVYRYISQATAKKIYKEYKEDLKRNVAHEED